jgi:hypothetical protein
LWPEGIQTTVDALKIDGNLKYNILHTYLGNMRIYYVQRDPFFTCMDFEVKITEYGELQAMENAFCFICYAHLKDKALLNTIKNCVLRHLNNIKTFCPTETYCIVITESIS